MHSFASSPLLPRVCVRACILIVWLVAFDTHASFIKIGTKCAARFANGAVMVNGTFENRGDETIESLQVVAQLGETHVSSDAFYGVETGQVVSTSILIETLPEAKGMHTVMVRVRYTDMSGHPYTALVPVPFVNGDPGYKTALSGELSETKFSESGQLSLEIASHLESETTVSYELVVPDEFICDERRGELLLSAGGTGTIVFDVRNRWGRAGSRYSVFAILNSLNGSVHQSEIVKGKVRLSKYVAMKARTRRLWWSAAIVLVAICVGLEVAAYQRERS